jgi:hypothetical protein
MDLHEQRACHPESFEISTFSFAVHRADETAFNKSDLVGAEVGKVDLLAAEQAVST